MSGFVIPYPKFRAFDEDGEPLAGGKLYAYEAGTTDPADTYSDAALTTPNTNPVILDANGEALVYIPDADTQVFKFVLTDADDVEQWTVDGVSIPAVEAPPAAQAVPTGGVLDFAGAEAPTGYLLCDGSVVSRTTYAALFDVIGEIYGAGDASTTFAIPDCRQRVTLGKADSGTGDDLGETGGAIDHTHTGPSHTHGATMLRDGWGGSQIAGGGTAGRLLAADGVIENLTQAGNNVAITTAAGGTGNTGGGNPPFIVFNKIIKT